MHKNTINAIYKNTINTIIMRFYYLKSNIISANSSRVKKKIPNFITKSYWKSFMTE